MLNDDPEFGLPAVGVQPRGPSIAEVQADLLKFGESKKQYVERHGRRTDKRPTNAQKESGRYRKGRISLHGLRIAIENPKGFARSGTSEDGKKWETKMHSHYGYIEGTEGSDTDPVDVFIGDDPESEFVVAINQNDPKTGRFDEHKIMLGYSSVASAKKCYMKNYESGWKGFGSATAMTMDQFKWWLETQDTKKPIKNGFFAAPENRKKQRGLALSDIEGMSKHIPSFQPVGKSKPRIIARITVTRRSMMMMPKMASTERSDEYKAESVKIRENQKGKGAKPHTFVRAEFLYPNMHPRCLLCGDEEAITDQCPGHKEAADGDLLSSLKSEATLVGSRGRAKHYGRAEPADADHDYAIFTDDEVEQRRQRQRLLQLIAGGYQGHERAGGFLTASGDGHDISVYPGSKQDQIMASWALQEGGMSKADAWNQVNKEAADKPSAKSMLPAGLLETAKAVDLEDYGVTFFHPEDKKVWFEVGDWHDHDATDPWVAKFNKIKGVSEVEVEHEAAPAKSKGWIRVWASGKKGPDWHDNPPPPPTVAVDLDGTLAKHFDKYDADSIPDPRPGAKKSMKEFKDRGYRVIIFTVRGDKTLVRKWLNDHDIPFDYINENPDQPEDASDKVLADVYVDDRGIDARSSWKRIEKQVVRRADKKAEDYEFAKSDISGVGIQATRNLEDGSFLGRAVNIIGQDPFDRDMLWLTNVGRYLNYSEDPNTELLPAEDGYDLHTTREVRDGEELTSSWKYKKEHAAMGSPQNAMLLNGTSPGTDST